MVAGRCLDAAHGAVWIGTTKISLSIGGRHSKPFTWSDLRAAGIEFDPTVLYHANAYYHLTLQRFISEDPAEDGALWGLSVALHEGSDS